MRRLPTKLFASATLAVLFVLSGCGGSDDGLPLNGGAPSCDLGTQKSWLRGYMADWYYWSGRSPNPEPGPYASVPDYFDALLFTGAAPVPADRWSYIESSASYNQFFGAGRTLGYGVSVNGLELQLPLKVRYVEALSPAAAAGLVRGDVISSINGRSAAELVAADDFSALTPAQAGDVLTLVIDAPGGAKTVTLTAGTYALTPVPTTRLLTLSNGAKAGYLVLKDFITQAEQPLDDAFTQFRAAGATELILDLRYNGGGRVSTAALLATEVAGSTRLDQVFARLTFNARQSASNGRYVFGSVPGAAFDRIVVLTGARTCSASELVINGLKPYATVVTIGDATCGKPVGFQPRESCGNTYSAVNFEGTNALGEGGYWNGIAASCAATDTFSGTLGDPAEALTGAAVAYLQSGSCPVAGSSARERSARFTQRAAQRAEPGERSGMWAD
ncbi:S41 family peptidase [Rhizobacter sp. P5_C2]